VSGAANTTPLTGGGGLGGAVSPIFGGNDSAQAAQGASLAQMEMAKRVWKEQSKLINANTVQGLASFDRDIKNQEKNLSRQEALISQIDPTIIEASQQALKLLRGEESSTLAPIKNQRNLQRQKLLNTLREQLGPGAETSTAGIQALTRFDSETNNLMSGQQQSALSQLGGLSSQFSSQRPDMFREVMGLSALNQGKTALGFQQSDALFRARQPMLGTAGGQFAGQAVQGAQSSAWGNKLFEAGVQGATAAMGGAPTPSPGKQPSVQNSGSASAYRPVP